VPVEAAIGADTVHVDEFPGHALSGRVNAEERAAVCGCVLSTIHQEIVLLDDVDLGRLEVGKRSADAGRKVLPPQCPTRLSIP